jgi:hypothetical protein
MHDKHVNIIWVADFRTTEEDKRSVSVGVRHSICYAFSVGVMNWFVREKDDYMFLNESYYLFSYIIDISEMITPAEHKDAWQAC